MSKWFKSDARYVRRTDQGAGPDESWTQVTGAAPTPSSGTFTLASLAYRYKQIGTTIHVVGRITITSVGTGTGNIVFQLPTAAALTGMSAMGVCRENLVVGYGGVVLKYGGSGTAVIVRTDNLNCCGNGYGVDFSITYEVPET